jgi:hypothetical protein
MRKPGGSKGRRQASNKLAEFLAGKLKKRRGEFNNWRGAEHIKQKVFHSMLEPWGDPTQENPGIMEILFRRILGTWRFHSIE